MRIPAGLGAALLLLATGCGDQQLDGWTSQQSVQASLAHTGPVRPPETEPRTTALDATSQVAITVPRVYRVELTGVVGRDGLTNDVAVGGWLLAVTAYGATGSAANDVNVVDLGLRTDTSPLDGLPGALWFGTHTSVMGDMDLGGVTPNAGPVDLVNEAVDGDLLVARVITELAPTNPLNLFDVDDGGVLGRVLAGDIQLRFDADAAQVVGRIDFADPVSGAEYHADLVGSATN